MFFPPLGLALFTLLKFKAMPLAFFILISTTLLLWLYQRYINDPKNKNLYLYFNLGLTQIKLYSFTFFLNIIILTIVNMYIKWMF
ncbi:hypothetical protein OD91_2501 [Lutibacter sp. Hel_I_33_5]|nr:hypothetical protein OD91_2501 [Lutibacter sp. Hel_I_33_5]